MIKKIKSLFGIKEILIEITWDNGEKEIILMKAYSPINAINKVSEIKDVVNKAKLTVLDQSRLSTVRHVKNETDRIATKKPKLPNN